MVAALEPGRVELLGAQVGRDPPVGGHRPVAVGRDERDDDAVPTVDDRPHDLDPAGRQPGCDQPARIVVAALADEACVCTE